MISFKYGRLFPHLLIMFSSINNHLSQLSFFTFLLYFSLFRNQSKAIALNVLCFSTFSSYSYSFCLIFALLIRSFFLLVLVGPRLIVLVACYATLNLTSSICRSVSWSVGRSNRLSIGPAVPRSVTKLIFAFIMASNAYSED